MFFFKSDISKLQQKIDTDTRRLNELKNQRGSIAEEFNAIKSSFAIDIGKQFNQRLLENQKKAGLLNTVLPPYAVPGWEAENWRNWKPAELDLHSSLHFGKMEEQDPMMGDTFSLPTIVDFIGQNICYFVESTNASSAQVYAFFQSLALRINARLLHNVNFTFIDPSGFGKAFPIARQLNTRVDSGDLFRLLEDIGKDITRINQTYGLSDDRMFDSISENVLINEKFEIIFAANFPKDMIAG